MLNATTLQQMAKRKAQKEFATPLQEVEYVHQPPRPRNGYIMRMDGRWQWSRRGKHRAMVVFLENLVRLDRRIEEHVTIAVDYTNTPRCPLHRMSQQWKGADSVEVMKQVVHNIETNAPTGLPLDELLGREQRDTAIILATGPSLRTQAPMLAHVDKSKAYIIALNSATLALPKGVTADYHFGIDRRMRPEWGENVGDTIGVFHPQAAPELVASNYKQRYFYGQPGCGFAMARMRAAYQDALGNVCEIEQGGNVGVSALHFAYLLGAKRIVFLGLDVCWEALGGKRELEIAQAAMAQGHTSLKFENMEATHWRRDVNKDNMDVNVGAIRINTGNGVFMSRIEYIKSFHLMMGAAFFLQEAGVRCYYCGEFGAYYAQPERAIPATSIEREDIHGNMRRLSPIESVPFGEFLDVTKIRRS